jgi:predicted permease
MSLGRDTAGGERVWGYLVSGNYFDVLGVQAALGRAFTQSQEDDAHLAHPVAVLAYGCWQRRFGGDPSVVGRTVAINGHPFSIVGVMPQGFTGTEIAYAPEIWVPMTMEPWIEPGSNWLDSRDTQNIFATGRLKAGVSMAQATASLNALAEQLGREYPETNEGQTIRLTPPGLIHPMLRDPVVGFTGVLMFVVLLVLVIACTNLANLLLGRAEDRRREVAVRLALGASRLRLVRQLLIESVLLALAGGAAGLALAVVIVRAAVSLQPALDFPLRLDLPIDTRVFGFSLLASVVTGVAFGLIPAIQATKPELVPALKDATSQAGHGRSLLRRGLVVAQVALSLVMLIAAGLVVRTLENLETLNPGFDARGALMMNVDLGLQGYDTERGRAFYPRLVERLRSVPGVEDATATSYVPLGLDFNATNVYVEGQPPVRGADVPQSMNASVGSEYFATMHIPIVAGRALDDRDSKDAPKVVVVNEAFVRRFFPGANGPEGAIGKRISDQGTGGRWFDIVGVAKDGRYFSIAETPRPFVYFSLSQSYSTSAALVVRTSSDPERMLGALRAAIAELDPTLPVYNVKTLTNHMALSLFPARVAASLLGGFGLLALTLAAIGIYGVMSYSVAQRTREIGIRMALGARPRDVLRLVVGQGLVLNAIGVAAGLAGAAAVTQFLSSVLYGVSATDALTYAAVVLLLTAVVVLASYVPAWRAAHVDPTRALRTE